MPPARLELDADSLAQQIEEWVDTKVEEAIEDEVRPLEQRIRELEERLEQRIDTMELRADVRAD